MIAEPLVLSLLSVIGVEITEDRPAEKRETQSNRSFLVPVTGSSANGLPSSRSS